ncbi:NAD(P)/FAD-dependent oxidoreductase [Parvularcula maris]|uniref:FAD-dependent oxidoreductase n=1 Tax=Parvularcula maris TaxID=2965077 RepID=A0A9X2RJ56_9PROT|nr:FAD-dependent oxidoreductase [Parvularcula maris]MCQ8184487.1 FAD-dependent oxidoreductase [Parvularcula maris]
MSSQEQIVIVGAGHGGTTAAVELRSRGFEGGIVLLSDEPVEPYERPPLSKAWLTADGAEKDSLYGLDTLSERGIDLRLGAKAETLDLAARSLRLGDGSELTYSALILATGSQARKLPISGMECENVFSLRTAGDADALRAALVPGSKLVVVGAGYIGLEVAASARKLGADVTIVELADRCMPRTASVTISDFYHQYHEEHGVAFVLKDGVSALEAEGDHVTGVALSSGSVLPADAVLIAAGGVPDDILAQQAGIACDNGILTDENGRTSDPSVYAIGDAARRPTPWAEEALRLESVHSALEMARLVAADITGSQPPALQPPWFWSDQYDLKLQIVGLVTPGFEQIKRHTEGSLSVFHLKGDELMAVEAVNDPRAYMLGRTALSKGLAVDRHVLSDPEADLKNALLR